MTGTRDTQSPGGYIDTNDLLAMSLPSPPQAGVVDSAAKRSGTPGQGREPTVKVIGYLRSEKGVGEGARATIRAMRAGGIPFAIEVLPDPHSAQPGLEIWAPGDARDSPAQINIFHVNPKELLQLRARLTAERAAGRTSIGYWAWELPELPAVWAECLGYLNEVWTPSAFVTQSVACAAAIPVITVPHCLDLDELRLASASLPGDRLSFFFAFDYLSDVARKNPHGVIEAFRRAFTPADRVELVIKSMHSSYDAEGAAAVWATADRAVADGVSVRIIDEALPRARVLQLLRNCHSYVSLHRAEGFGLLLAEAMALGKPVIATGYSGNTDFMSPSNSLLVNHSMVDVGPGHGDYEPHQRWADPDLDHAASLMRLVADDREVAARIGAQAREDVIRTLHPAAVGTMVRDHVSRLNHGHAPRALTPRAECSIIIPVYGHAPLTLTCLQKLLSGGLDQRLVEIIVVDDASPDETPRMLAAFKDAVRVVTHASNMGFGQSCNDGAAVAESDILVLLNNDTVPRRGWLDALLGYARVHPDAGIVGAKLLYPDGCVQHAGVTICEDRRPRHLYRGFPQAHPAVSVSRRFQVVTAACMLVHRALFWQLGGFDVAFRNGFEDVDLCLRAGDIGAEVHYCADCVIEHHESATRRGRPDEELRNFQIYWDRWAHQVTPDEFMFYAADGLIRIRQKDRYPLQFDISPELGGEIGSKIAENKVPVPHVQAAPPARSLPRPRTQGLPGSLIRPRLAPPQAGTP
jgi:GT2 family glycosyltransferase/glycosyltransferase involved in cell wall biosynthesis